VSGLSRPVLIASVALLVLIAGIGGTALALDAGTEDRLPDGTVIGNVPVGGLTTDQAVDQLRPVLEGPLRRPLHVEAERFSADTTPWDLGLRLDVAALVRDAYDETRGSNFLVRAWRRVFPPGARFFEAKPAWSQGDMDQLLQRATEAVRAAPVDADIDVSSGWVRIVPERAGRVLDVEESRRRLHNAVHLGDTQVKLVSRPVEPNTDREALSRVILVRTGENRLYLYEAGRIVRSWDVATGLPDYPTPVGVFRVVSKLVNPTWVNPGSKWSRNLPPRIGPGPSNPLGTRALQLSAPAILIHATSQSRSIGYNASHGCIRMTEADEKELFGMVGVGTRVAIVSAGPPRVQGAPLPTNATPEQTAAAVF
jgi:lipoprotein-anchoring transpeptidase ErfK/SrfK